MLFCASWPRGAVPCRVPPRGFRHARKQCRGFLKVRTACGLCSCAASLALATSLASLHFPLARAHLELESAWRRDAQGRRQRSNRLVSRCTRAPPNYTRDGGPHPHGSTWMATLPLGRAPGVCGRARRSNRGLQPESSRFWYGCTVQG